VVIEAAGAKAIATTSAGVAWAAGVPDGGGLTRERALDALRRIASVVSVPLSADIEGGYGPSPEEVALTVTEVISAGAVGINLEDTPGDRGRALLEPGAQADRLMAAREAAQAAGIDMCINARTDTYLAGAGSPDAELLGETMARAERYAAAGADVLFVPGVIDADVIRVLVAGPLPVNVMVSPGAPSVAELAALGVARVSVGSAITQAAYGLAAAAARQLLTIGTYDLLDTTMGYGHLNDLLR
jgi:2-methylisocitrate lyase-like PEP mutase family enzyme